MTAARVGSKHHPSPVQLDCSSPSAAQILPFETIVSILTLVALAPAPLVEKPRQQPPSRRSKGTKHTVRETTTYSPTWTILLLSKSLTAALEPVIYSRVSLTSTIALDRFARTLKERPDLNRKVKSLWIAPNSLESDFITALKPADGINSLPAHLNQPLTHIRQILRACRSIRHVALDGCLCSRKAASSFGSNCQPLSLVSINPYSFLGGFSAPMFRKLRRLEMCDTSMASEEVEQIRNLSDLCHFVWTSPRDYSDSKRDINSLFRIITPSISPSHLQLSVAGAEDVNVEEVLPVKPDYHRHLRTVTIATERGRGAELGSKLKRAVQDQEMRMRANDTTAAQDLTDVFSTLSFDRTTRSSEVAFGGSSVPYVDSSAHTSSIVHPATGVRLQTKPLRDESIIDEWECLRDLICGSGSTAALEEMRRKRKERIRKAQGEKEETEEEEEEDYERGKAERMEMGDGNEEEADAEEEIQPGLALRRLWIDWCIDASFGGLEVPDFKP